MFQAGTQLTIMQDQPFQFLESLQMGQRAVVDLCIIQSHIVDLAIDPKVAEEMMHIVVMTPAPSFP